MQIGSLVSRIVHLLGAVGLMAATPALAQDRQRDAPELSPTQQDWLAAHNAARAEVGLAPLRWDNDLERDARAWAINLAARGAFQHSSELLDKGHGENLWRGTRNRYAPSDMVGSWIAEQRDFRPGVFPDVSRTGRWADVGHYTQIIWPGTRKVGCAAALNPGQEVLVCRYAPAGNVVGERLDPNRRSRKRR